MKYRKQPSLEEQNLSKLRAVCAHGTLEELKILHQNGADLSVFFKGTMPLYDATLIGTASALGNTEIVQYLLENGADPNDSRTPFPPLVGAATNSALAVVQLLLNAGANVNAPDYSGRTALMAAQKNNHQEMIELLLQHGAK
jgi:ankyrin repeat protein